MRAEQLHASDWLGVLHITGGGSPLIAELLATPGASGTILEVVVPYSSQALTDLLGQAPERAASQSTARLLAMAAFERACALDHSANFGLGCTASLGSNREKKGTHRAHWAIQTTTTTYSFNAQFDGDRESEEAALLEYLWASLQHCLLGLHGPLADWQNDANIQYEHHPAPDEWHALIGNAPHVWSSDSHNGRLLLPGSFNPIHQGHKQMLAVAETLTGYSGAYELCVKNADKPSLDYLTIAERVMQFDSHPVWLTNTPTYVEKARQFAGTTFALGVDTLARIVELRFYQDSQALLDQAIATFVDLDTHFLVFGRSNDSAFVTLDDIDIPDALRQLCTEVPESTYRNDASSSQIRQRKRPP